MAAARSSTSSISWSFSPGITGAKPTITGTPASDSSFSAASRRSGVEARGSIARASLRSRVVMEIETMARLAWPIGPRMSLSRAARAFFVVMVTGFLNRESTFSTSRVIRSLRSIGW